MTVLGGGRLVTPAGIIERGWVSIDGAHIAEVGSGAVPAGAVDVSGNWILPGFVDLHMHGGGGHSVVTGEPEGVLGAVAFHRRHGTTTTLVSLVTAPSEAMVAASSSIARLLRDDAAARAAVAGLHLEGPFLSIARCGAQDPDHMIDPDPRLLAELLEAAGGALRVITLAPERPGALAMIGALVGAGVVAAIGHTDASHDETTAAIAAGARLATHLGNGMRPFHHREPGAIGACLTEPDVVCELIADGHHLHPATVRLAARAKGPGGLALITDAIAAAGAPDGRYAIGTRRVDAVGGVTRLVDGGTLCGSTLTMDAAVRNVVGWGIPIDVASRAASLTPARVLGIDGHTGSIEAGKRADLVVADEELAVVGVVAAGELVHGELGGSS